MKKLNVNINGNTKLKNNEKIRFMIWNLPAQKTCPFATELCKKSCYAKKAERLYKNVLPCREQNYINSLEYTFVDNMIFTIENLLNNKAFNGKKAVFRIHESGDFYNLEYAIKWYWIAKHFENDNRIIFTAYTKSIIYFINLGYGLNDFPKNLIIRASLWDDTRKDLKELIFAYNFPVYTALKDIPKNNRYFTECRCSDCATCLKCYTNDYKNIAVKIH